jgi:NTE family protein
VQQRTLDFLLAPEFKRKQRELFRAQPSEDIADTGGLFSWYHSVAEYLQAHHTLSRAVTRRSLLPGALLEDVVNHLLPDADIAEATIPLGVAAIDLLTGRRVVLERGPLRRAVRASASLPGIFPPVEFDGMLLCDLGVLTSLPVRLARKYDPRVLVGVDVGSNLKPLKQYATALDVLMRIIEIGETYFREELRAEADLVIAPDVGDVEWSDFTGADRLIAVGRAAARKALSNFSREETIFAQFSRMWNNMWSVRPPTKAEVN